MKYQLKVFPSLFHSTYLLNKFLNKLCHFKLSVTICFSRIFMESYLLSNIITCSSFAISRTLCVPKMTLQFFKCFRKYFSFLEGSMEYLGLYLTIF